METEVEVSVPKVKLTPEIIAKAFWAMDSEGQADFFEALADQIGHPISHMNSAYNLGEMQWCYLHSELQLRGGKGLSMYLAMSAFAFEFSQDHCGLQTKSTF